MDKGCNCGTIHGIKCEVSNCKYHSPECRCEAGEITVGPHKAVSSSDTVCRTFEAK